MLKVGDKVKVTYADGDQFVGRIVGETAKQWKVDFDGTGEKRVNKSMDVELVDDPKTPEPEVITTIPEETEKCESCTSSDEETHYTRKEFKVSKKVRRQNAWILVGILLSMAAVSAAIIWGVGLF